MSEKEDFLKAVLKLFFYQLYKSNAKICKDDKYEVTTVILDLPTIQYIVRIYSDHYNCMTSHAHPGHQMHTGTLNPIEFEEFFKTVLTDDIPF